MRIIVVAFILAIHGYFGKAQTQTQRKYPIDLPTYNIGSLSDYTIQAKVVGNNIYEYTIRKESHPKKDTSFTLRPNTIYAFRDNVEDKIKGLFEVDKEKAKVETLFASAKQDKLDLLFYQFVSSEVAIGSYDDRPKAGKIVFNRNAKVYPEFSESEEDKMNAWITFKLDSAKARKDVSDDWWVTHRPSPDKFDSALNRTIVRYDSVFHYTIDYGSNRYTRLDRKGAEERLHNILSSIFTPVYSVNEVEIEFNEGFVENIKVILENNTGTVLKFENYYPIGFSTKRDFSLLPRIRLFSGDFFVPLSEVILRYEQKHEVNRRDYSPANEVVNFDFEKYPDGTLTIHKETTAKLFELKTFSDFVGLDESSPNGLLQIELDKRINLVTRRRRLFLSERVAFGLMQSITPFLVKSKLEENNKYLLLNTRDRFFNNQYSPVKFASTLDLKRFENLSIGADLNWFLIDFPSSKVTYYLYSGIRYGRVAVRDSIRVFQEGGASNSGFVKEFGVNTLQVMPLRAMVEFKADERYSVDMAWSANLLYLRDNYFFQVSNIPAFHEDGILEKHSRYMYHNIAFGTAFRPSKTGTGKLFFRYRYNWQQGYWRTGFHQAQVGFSVFLTKTLKPGEIEN